MKQPTAAIFGFVAASLFPAIYLAIVFPVAGDHRILSMAASFIIFYPFSSAAALIFGIPGVFALKKFGLVAWWSSVGYGAISGVLTLLLITFGGHRDFASLLRFAILGAISGLIFWAFWRSSAHSTTTKN